MNGKILRHSLLVRLEHWAVALSGMALLFSGIGQMPMYQRYGLTKLPGMAWSGDFLLTLQIHYAAAAVFMGAMAFHVVYHGFLKETAAVPRRGDLKESLVIILAMLGVGEEPRSHKFLAEQRIAYAVIGWSALVLSLTGILKVMKNAGWIFLPPGTALINTTLHNLGFVVFLLGFLAHLAAFLVPANWPLVPSMFTGHVDLAYARHRHPLWLADLGSGDGLAAAPIGGPAAPGTASGPKEVGLSDADAAELIGVVLRAEGQVPLEGLGEGLGLSDRQVGMALGHLILQGKATIRERGATFVVQLPDEPPGRAARPPGERR